MNKKSRSFLLISLVPLVPLVLSGGVFAAVQAKSTKPLLWSDPATWPDHKVPKAGDKVSIESGKDVVLDVSPPPLNGLHIEGKLTFADKKDLDLTTEWIMVHGELDVGSEAKPFTHKATITLTDNVKSEEMAGMGDRGIMLSGGTLSLHGVTKNTWTKLSKTAEVGSSSIEVLDAKGWKVGDEIVLASTDFNPRQAERRTISAIKGNTISFDKKLDYMHFGKITFDVDERGEVGLLTRNIKIQASADAEQSFFGGHVMAMVTSHMFVEGVEFNRMGQNLTLARYPIHWHLVGNADGQYVKNSAFHDTYNRCVTVHGTNDLRIENNVTYNTVGHCFFLEDGIEHGNQFVHNLAIQTKCHTSRPCIPTNLAASGEIKNGTNGQQSKDVLLPSDNTVSSFWITNPDNVYVANVAAGSDENGFWMSLPEHPNGAFADTDASKATWSRRTKFREFKGNVAHSNYDSFMFDRNINPNNTFAVTGDSLWARENPADANSKPLEIDFEDLTAYKNRNGGIWGRGIGYTHAAGFGTGFPFTSKVVDSLFVGETENIGNPSTDSEKAYGRTLPKPELPDFPIRGYEFYDRRHDVENVTFRNFQDNATRKTGALSYLMFTSFAVTSNNSVERVKFINAKPVYFPPMQGNAKWASDNGSSVAWKTAVIRDLDGSLTGVANAYVLIDDGVIDSLSVDAQVCERRAEWNATVCKGDVGRLSINGPGGPPPGPGQRPVGAPGAGGVGAGTAAASAAAGSGAAGARAGGGGGAPPPPVILSRNGKQYDLTATTVRAGTEIKVATERPSVSLNLTELDPGSWVVFELPGFNSAASGAQQGSLDALRKASETSYFKDKDALWVKVVSTADGGRGGGGSLQVSR